MTAPLLPISGANETHLPLFFARPVLAAPFGDAPFAKQRGLTKLLWPTFFFRPILQRSRNARTRPLTWAFWQIPCQICNQMQAERGTVAMVGRKGPDTTL